MANSIALITKYSTEYFDKVYKQEAVTSLLDANPKMVKFEGARTVKIAKLATGGMLDYDRNVDANNVSAGGNGYGTSTAVLRWEEFTLSQDRAAKFPIEYFDNEESGGELVGLATTEISRTIIVPEVDAYCLSKLADLANNAGNSVNTAITASNALTALNTALQVLEENEVPTDDQIIYCTPAFMTKLRESSQVTKFLTQSDYGKNVSFRMEAYEGRPIVVVTPRRLHAGYTKLATGGYNFAAGSAGIEFMVVAKSAVMHVVKYEKVKVISGDLNLAGNGFDGYTIYARIYHDVFVPDNKLAALYVHFTSAASPEGARTLVVKTSGGNLESFTITNSAELDMKDVVIVKGTGLAGNVGGLVSVTSGNITEVKIGDALSNGTAVIAAIKKGTNYYAVAPLVTVA